MLFCMLKQTGTKEDYRYSGRGRTWTMTRANTMTGSDGFMARPLPELPRAIVRDSNVILSLLEPVDGRVGFRS